MDNKPNAIILDTNILVHDPNSISHFIIDNIVFIPISVINELDGLKKKTDIGEDVRTALRNIEKLTNNNPYCKIINIPSFNNLSSLNPDVVDHQIIATASNIKQNNNDKYKKIKIISKDTAVRILSRHFNIIAEDYFRDQVVQNVNTELERLNVPYSIIQVKDNKIFFDLPTDCTTPLNTGVICLSDWNGLGEYPSPNISWNEAFTAIRRYDHFEIIPRDISIFGIHPKTINNDINWEQYIAIKQLMSPNIKAVFLQGSTGSGKTLLALASALEQRKYYRQILVSRPMIHLEDDDKMGFLPGDINEKMNPWLRPIWNTFKYLANTPDKIKLLDKLKSEGKIAIEPLDYIRGMTFYKDFIIVDEAQNLTPHQIKTIITRIGSDSKIIFTGDLRQIDRKKMLDKKSSGLAYASNKMAGHKLIGSIQLKHTVRSELAEFAEQVL